MTKFFKANKHGNSAQEKMVCPRPSPNKDLMEEIEHEQHPELNLGPGKFTRTLGKCPHDVRKCRSCVVTPLLDDNGIHISYLLEHRRKMGRAICCTIGNKGLATPRILSNKEDFREYKGLNTNVSPRKTSKKKGSPKPMPSIAEEYDVIDEELPDLVTREEKDDSSESSSLFSEEDSGQFDDSDEYFGQFDDSEEEIDFSRFGFTPESAHGLDIDSSSHSQFTFGAPPVEEEEPLGEEEARVIIEGLQQLHNPPTMPDSQDQDVSHIQSTIGSQLGEVQNRLARTVSSSLIRKSTQAITQVVLLAIGLNSDTNLQSILTRCITFLDSLLEDGIAISLFDILGDYVSAIELPDVYRGETAENIYNLERNANQPESGEPQLMEMWNVLRKGVFTKHMSYIVGTAFAFFSCKINNVEFNHPLHDAVMKHADTDSINGIDFIDHVLKLYNWCSTVGLACITQKSLLPITLNSGALAKCHETLYTVRQWFIDMKRTGKSTSEERQAKYVEIETIYRTLRDLCKVERDKYTTLQASTLIKEVGILYNELKDIILKIDAVKVAFAIHIHGPPKSGKSYACPLIHEQICLARNVEYRKENNAQPNLMAKYQDELDNSTQTITINETSAVKEQYSQSIEMAYTTALALVDPVPYHPNRSNLEDKARIVVQAISIISTGNTEEPFLHVAKTPGAWCRRYLSVYMKPKPEYADAHGRFDESKTDGSNNYHTFDVYEIIYNEDGSKVRQYFSWDGGESKKMDTRNFLELIRQLAKEHFAREDRLEAERKKEHKKGCTECQRLSHFCICKKENEPVTFNDFVPVESAVMSTVPLEHACDERSVLGPHCSEHHFGEHGVVCKFCKTPNPNIEDNEPESGIAKNILAFGGRIAMESLASWINPFVNLKRLWSIDSAVYESLREDLLDEVNEMSDDVALSTFSLVPEGWLKKRDGSRSFLAKMKEKYIKFVAAEKQIFLPIRVLLKRAFTLSFLFFIFLSSMIWLNENYWYGPIINEMHVPIEIERWEHGRLPIFPEYSKDALSRREFYARIGIHTRRHLEWAKWHYSLNRFQKLLGRLTYPAMWKVKDHILVIEEQKISWWYYPLVFSTILFFMIFLHMWLKRVLGYRRRYEELQRRASSDRDFQTSLYERGRRSVCEYNSLVPTAAGVLGVILTGLSIWNVMRIQSESGIVRKGTKAFSWDSFMSFGRKSPESSLNRGVTDQESVARVGKNSCLVRTVVGGKPTEVIGNWVEVGFLLLPAHLFKPNARGDVYQDKTVLNISTRGFTTNVTVYAESLDRIPGKDAVVIFVPRAPTLRHTLYDMLPTTTGSDRHSATLVHYREEPEVTNAEYIDRVDCGGMDCGRGVTYKSKVTGLGYCGTPIVHKRVIMGFHISGYRETPFSDKIGNAQEILRQDVEAHIEKMKSKQWGVISSPEAGDNTEVRLGYQLITGPGPHPMTKVFEELNDFHGIEVLGHNKNLVRYKSRVRKSLLSETLTTITGRPNRWKPPDMRKPWVTHNKALKVVAEGAREVPPSALNWACDDYLADIEEPLDVYIKEYPNLCRVLTNEEMINGVEGSIYMKPVNMKTSIGPIGKASGSKVDSNLFVEIEPGLRNEKRYRLSDEALVYFENMEKCFLSGKKYNVWTRTCLKDEVVAEDSDKVRIFYIIECIFALLVRKYFLPVAEFISRHPLLTECAVGINCAGPEWEELIKYVTELTEDEMLTDWDYSKYDLRRSPDVMVASLRIFLYMCKRMGYDKDSLRLMEMASHELRNPTIDWNGTVLTAWIWPSGNTMTVYGNSLENSLHNRISFYVNGKRKLSEEEFKALGPFRKNERIATYGDDGMSGSRPEARKLCNFPAKFSYFDEINMKITDAAKSANPPDVVHMDDVDFLKRKSVYHERLNTRVGALSPDSIDKMGHMVSGRGELEELAVCSIITMLLESFLHGEKFYENMRSDLKSAASTHNLDTRYLDYSYEELAKRWEGLFNESNPDAGL